MKNLAKMLYKKGFKATPQRLEIINYLMNTKSHPSAEEVYKYLKEKFPTVSFATVYNTLETLKKSGDLKELSIDPDRKRFDMDLSPHDHFYCKKCKKVIDIYENKFNKKDIPYAIEDNIIEEVSLFYIGICKNCQKI